VKPGSCTQTDKSTANGPLILAGRRGELSDCLYGMSVCGGLGGIWAARRCLRWPWGGSGERIKVGYKHKVRNDERVRASKISRREKKHKSG
jgi:hypothetical protein